MSDPIEKVENIVSLAAMLGIVALLVWLGFKAKDLFTSVTKKNPDASNGGFKGFPAAAQDFSNAVDTAQSIPGGPSVAFSVENGLRLAGLDGTANFLESIFPNTNPDSVNVTTATIPDYLQPVDMSNFNAPGNWQSVN